MTKKEKVVLFMKSLLVVLGLVIMVMVGNNSKVFQMDDDEVPANIDLTGPYFDDFPDTIWKSEDPDIVLYIQDTGYMMITKLDGVAYSFAVSTCEWEFEAMLSKDYGLYPELFSNLAEKSVVLAGDVQYENGAMVLDLEISTGKDLLYQHRYQQIVLTQCTDE